MKIKSLKTGKYSLHPAWGPIIDVIKGEDINFDLDKDQIDILISYGVIDNKEQETKQESKQDFDNRQRIQYKRTEKEPKQEQVMTKLFNLIENIDDESEKKSIIQDWGIVNAGKKISKSRSVDDMIIKIVEIIKSNKK